MADAPHAKTLGEAEAKEFKEKAREVAKRMERSDKTGSSVVFYASRGVPLPTPEDGFRIQKVEPWGRCVLKITAEMIGRKAQK